MTVCTCEPCTSSGACTCTSDELPYDPFLSLNVAHGMLLGEDDFVSLSANPRGKLMLHNAWLHGSGVVWGFPVIDELDPRALRVRPGLAIDGLGRELHLDSDRCLDLDCWANERAKLLVPKSWETDEDGCETVKLCTWLVAGFDTCLTRPVPALADFCDPSHRVTGHSRVFETIQFNLVESDPCPTHHAFHGVRVLLGLERSHGRGDEIGRLALAARMHVAQLPEGERAEALLCAFRQAAARDVTKLRPPQADGDECANWFPVCNDEPVVVLARVELKLVRVKECVRVTSVEIEEEVRCALLPTKTIQELLCGLAPGVIGVSSMPDAGGPRVIPESVRWLDDRTFEFQVTHTLLEGSLKRGSIKVTTVSQQGWNEVDIREAIYVETLRLVQVSLHDRPTFDYVRLVVKGTGATPILGDSFIPLAGVVGGPAGSEASGHDAELVIGPGVHT